MHPEARPVEQAYRLRCQCNVSVQNTNALSMIVTMLFFQKKLAFWVMLLATYQYRNNCAGG